MVLVFYINHKWSITLKNYESLYCTPITCVVHQLYFNKKKICIERSRHSCSSLFWPQPAGVLWCLVLEGSPREVLGISIITSGVGSRSRVSSSGSMCALWCTYRLSFDLPVQITCPVRACFLICTPGLIGVLYLMWWQVPEPLMQMSWQVIEHMSSRGLFVLFFYALWRLWLLGTHGSSQLFLCGCPSGKHCKRQGVYLGKDSPGLTYSIFGCWLLSRGLKLVVLGPGSLNFFLALAHYFVVTCRFHLTW